MTGLVSFTTVGLSRRTRRHDCGISPTAPRPARRCMLIINYLATQIAPQCHHLYTSKRLTPVGRFWQLFCDSGGESLLNVIMTQTTECQLALTESSIVKNINVWHDNDVYSPEQHKSSSKYTLRLKKRATFLSAVTLLCPSTKNFLWMSITRLCRIMACFKI